MKYKLLTFVLVLFGAAAFAQSISVKSFRPLPNDMTASSLDGKKIDQNGEVAALIKVVTTQTGFVFDNGSLGIVATRQVTGEVWVWVPRGTRRITISHQKLGVLRDYEFPVAIEAERTYEMVLVTGKVETIVKEEVRQQYLAFQVSPPNATLEVNDQIWGLDSDGSAMKYVPFGSYTYRIMAKDYHTEAGKVEVNDPDNAQKVSVTLRPAFGWNEVTASNELNEARVYIDNNYIGMAPIKSGNISSGQHNVRIAKEMYATYSETVTVNDNQTTRVSPTLKADFANITLKVDADAEIWVNNEKKGTHMWTGRLGSGTYKIECKQPSHENSLTTKEIKPAMNGQTITLPAPRPIYGSLNVETTPAFARLYIDGKDMGETPKAINEILVGQHTIKLTKDGYSDYTETVTIRKGERTQVKATLTNGRDVRFTCNVANAALYVDGTNLGNATGTYRLKDGQHSVKATAQGYHDFNGNFTVVEQNTDFSISMEAVLKNRETITVNGVSFTMIGVEGGTFTMGCTDEQGSDCYSTESPAHSVTLSGYYIGETEVTQALWNAVMGSYNNPSSFKGDNLPVDSVNRNDCQKFIHNLNRITGRSFRLPTEAEWEYAARGGKKSKGYKYAGSNNMDNVAVYEVNSYNKGSNSPDYGTHPVKTKQPNELGLYDMSGNVWEWCQDWFGNYSSGSLTSPKGPSTGSDRVLRGGCWFSIAWKCRVSNRGRQAPDICDCNLGLRLVLPQ